MVKYCALIIDNCLILFFYRNHRVKEVWTEPNKPNEYIVREDLQRGSK